MKVLFLGSSHFSKVVLQNMIENGIDICVVITSPDKKVGRGHKIQPNEVKMFALENGIDVLCSSKIKNDFDKIKEMDFDISIVASFGQILPKEFLDLKLCLNVHPSMLPKYRGASPIQNSILNGDEFTAVTIMKVAQAVDSGDIALQEKVKIMPNEFYSSLEERLAKIGGELACKAILLFDKNQLEFTKQDDTQAVYVKKFEKEDGRLDFNNSKEHIFNQVRALSENLGTYLVLRNQTIKIFNVDVSDCKTLKCGEISNDKKHFIIGCNDGAIEILMCLAPSGKKMTGADFLNGFKPQGEFVS